MATEVLCNANLIFIFVDNVVLLLIESVLKLSASFSNALERFTCGKHGLNDCAHARSCRVA